MAKRTNVLDPETPLQQAKSLAGDAAREVRSQAKGIASQAQGQVRQLVERRKDQMADRLGLFASALRDAGRTLDDSWQPGDFGQYADRAAHQVERLSTYLHDNDLRRLIRDTENFARRRPEVFLGGTFVAGLLLARFLKASGAGERRGTGHDGGAWTG